MIYSRLQLILSFLVLTMAASSTARAQHTSYSLIPNCDQFLTPVYGEQILIFNPLTYEHIQQHSISKLISLLQKKQIAIDFIVKRNSMEGYQMQGNMLARIVQKLFPPLSRKNKSRTIKIEVKIIESALKGRTKSELLTDFEMSLLKSGSPFVAPLSKTQVRAEFNIPKDAKVAAFYADDEYMFKSAFSALRSKPEIVILSTKETLFLTEMLHAEFPEYELASLTDLEKQKSLKIFQRPTLILNDTKRRMMEVYTASDYAVVIGSNNIFEPLQSARPTIYFKNHLSKNTGTEYMSAILSGYNTQFWKIMDQTASKTHGTIGITEFHELPGAIEQIEKIRPQDILHPAFVTPEGSSQSRFNDILDQIEALVRQELNWDGISL